MMDPSETDNFKDQWKKALENASEPPPPSVWQGIEARLDRDEKDIIPLWWRTPKLWYAAASIVALLLVGGGVWFNSHNSVKGLQGTSAEMASTKQPTTGQEENVRDKTTGTEEKMADEAVTGGVEMAETHSQKEPLRETNQVAGGLRGSIASEAKKNQQIIDIKKNETALLAESKQVEAVKEGDIVKELNLNSSPTIVVAKEEFKGESKADKSGSIAPVESILPGAGSALAVNALKPVPYSELEVYLQKRYVFFKPQSVIDEPLPEVKKRSEYWAGIGVMPASFNPDVQIKDAPVAFAAMQNSRQKALTGTNKAGNSYALQTQGGVRFSKHWSLEMGVSYLKGNAKYEGGGQILDAVSAHTSNVLENALIGLSNKVAVPNSPNFGGSLSSDYNYSSSMYLDVNKNVSNNYQYLQLPVQAGFTLNPDKKLSYSVLGGMMANFFLSNELEAAAGNTIKTTAGDDVYRSMNWAATTGLRFNYKLSSRWKANLTGSYQKAISSGFKANQSLESHPYLYGVSWGVRYSF